MKALPNNLDPAKMDQNEFSAEQESQFDNLTGAKIMMIDDEPINSEMVKIFLEEVGYEHFITVDDSVKAFDLIASEKPDVVLLDLMMPEVSGFDILKQVRADKKLKYTPIIILTSSTDAETKMKALRLGANDFLGKPVDPSELVLRIRNTLAAKVYQDRLAHFDVLTDLPNRQTFISHLDWALHKSKKEQISGAVLKLDLDRFKEINDTLGPEVGDVLLQEVARRLIECLRYGDTVGRFGQDLSQTGLSRIGGNEFAVLLPSLRQLDDIVPIAERVLQSLVPAFHPQQHELYITCSVGIAVFPRDGHEINTLLKHADIALSHAKQKGGNCYQFYADGLNTKSVARLKMANDLRKAADRGELEMFYQPKINVHTGQLIGGEALMRWNHPKLGLVSPGIFIPLAEDINLLPEIDEWAFLTTCEQLVEWQKMGKKIVPVSINITSQSFRQGRVVGTVRNVLNKSGLAPKHVKLELTESAIMENAKENIEVLYKLKEEGIKLSIDDFGTGYSSLSYLNRFPIDELKIDQSFIGSILTEPSNLAIVKAILAMAGSLDLHVVAEGVETKEQLMMLQSLNCLEYQGYYFSKPVPAKYFLELLS